MDELLHYLICEASVSGKEKLLCKKVYNDIKKINDNTSIDNDGNIISTLNKAGKHKLMISAHIDEIGLIVVAIMPNAMLRVASIGITHINSYLGQKVRIHTRNGVVYGAVAISKIYNESKDLNISDIMIDLGETDVEKVKKYVSVGDVITLDTDYRLLGNDCITGRALDNKIGVYIIIETIKRAIHSNCNSNVYFSINGTEETIKRGIYQVSSKVNPDMCIVVDATSTNDFRGEDGKQLSNIKLGNGPVVCNGPVIADEINEALRNVAFKNGIEIQEECAYRFTSSDADMIYKTNPECSIAILSYPLRYLHSPSEIVNKKDIEKCIVLLTEFISSV